ncbi:MAG: bifunctional phosphoglucose/phosphomannose isomerase [bacterium]
MTKTILDNRSEIKKIDKSNVLGSIEALPDQIQDAWDNTKSITFPASYSSYKNVVVSGMGGSALGSYVIKNLFKDELKIPFEVVSHYSLPSYVDSDTLVLLSSYSGTTEETLSCADSAKEKQAKIMVITSGGKLAELAKENNWPLYLINPKFNPSGQPRMAIGYALFGQLALFTKLGLLNIKDEQVKTLVSGLRNLSPKLTVEAVENNTAKFLAYSAFDKLIVLSGAEHLIGAVHVTNNQLNENAKTLTAEWHLPELNHHFMEGLSHPKIISDLTIFLLYNSHLYSPALTKRVEITKQLIEKMGHQVEVIQATAPTKLEQVCEVIMLGAYFNFYLAMLYGVDPAPIPNVDWFKAQMSK